MTAATLATSGHSALISNLQLAKDGEFRQEAESVKTSSRLFRFATVCILVPLLVTPSEAVQQPQSGNTAASTFRDVRLEPGGKLQLTVVSMAGQQLADRVVTVWFNKNLVCRTKSSADGRVNITGLRPGLHMIQVGDGTLACRLWSAQSAPPNAISNPAFVAGDSTIRGQYGPMVGAPMMPMMAPAVLATGVTATALAVVLIGKSSSSDNSIILPASP